MQTKKRPAPTEPPESKKKRRTEPAHAPDPYRKRLRTVYERWRTLARELGGMKNLAKLDDVAMTIARQRVEELKARLSAAPGGLPPEVGRAIEDYLDDVKSDTASLANAPFERLQELESEAKKARVRDRENARHKSETARKNGSAGGKARAIALAEATAERDKRIRAIAEEFKREGKRNIPSEIAALDEFKNFVWHGEMPMEDGDPLSADRISRIINRKGS